jgi:hypothetical protein
MPESASSSGSTRVLHFPADYSLGVLKRRVMQEDGGEHREPAGEAIGEVAVAADAELVLHWSYLVRDFTPLLRLAPDDLYRLFLPKNWSGEKSTLPALAHLSGLRDLWFIDARISLTSKDTLPLRHPTVLELLEAVSVLGLCTQER